MPPTRKTAWQKSSAWRLIEQAMQADQAFKYATVAAGLLALVTIVLRFDVSLPILLGGALFFLVLMTMYVIFKAVVNGLRQGRLKTHAAVLSWTSLLVFVAVVIALFTSIFWNEPLPIKERIIQEMIPSKEDEATPPPVTTPPEPATTPATTALPSEQESIQKDRKLLLILEIQRRKEESMLYVQFLSQYPNKPNAYRLEASKLYGPTISDGRDHLELDIMYLPAAHNIDHLSKNAGLDENVKHQVKVFESSYARFLASIEDFAHKRQFVIGMHNLRKFAQEATISATHALCALDADLKSGPSSGPVPFGCAPVHK